MTASSSTATIQLRVNGDHAALVDHDAGEDRVLDPRQLALDDELVDTLHEWARVVGAVRRSAAPGGPAASAVVSRRGLQLARRVAVALGVPVGYVDPHSGVVHVVDANGAGRRRDGRHPEHGTGPYGTDGVNGVEPVPWLTGLTVSAVSLVLLAVSAVTLAVALADAHALLALASNVVVTAGLLPSLWLIHRLPVWRWVAYGMAGGILLAWLALPFILI